MKGLRKAKALTAMLFMLAAVMGSITQVAQPAQGAAVTQQTDAINRMDGMYRDLDALQLVIKAVDQQIRAVRKTNHENVKTVRSRIRAVDQNLLARRKNEADQTRQKHAVLLAQYSSLGKQATAARQRKDKQQAALIDLKRNALKTSVTAARADIKAKNDALAAAKKHTALKVTPAKEALKPIQAIREQVTGENKILASYKKSRAAADRRFKSSIKQGNAATALIDMSQAYVWMGKISASQKKIYTLEQSIAKAIGIATGRLP